MAQADLECYDENGFVTLTAATLFGRTLASFNTGTSNGSLYVAGLTSGGAEWWFMDSPTGSDSLVSCLPEFSIANDVISWTFTDFYGPGGAYAPRYSCNVLVGIN